jgi:hypothetical protein
VSANTSGLLLDDSATSKSDGEDCVGLAENWNPGSEAILTKSDSCMQVSLITWNL